MNETVEATAGSPVNAVSAVEAAAGIARGELSAETLVRACLDRIAAREDQVQAWAYLDPDHAIAQARRCDREPSHGPLHGLPVGVKDVLDTADMPTLWGDEATFADRRPTRDAPVVQRLREAGAVLLGKTAISRFGFWWPGKTRNPHNLAHSPGSSSSGSAAAVADFMCPLAIGTQTVGSIMRPAAFCGLVGLKPSHDWMPWRQSRDYAPTLDVVGGLTRSVADMSLLMRGLTGRDAFDPDASRDGPITIGLYRTTDWDAAPAYTHEIYENTAARLSKAGCRIKDIDLPAQFKRLNDTIDTVGTYESARSFEWELTHHADKLEPGLRELLERGKSCSRERYLAAWDHGERCRRTFGEAIGDVDCLMVPGALGEAPPATSTGPNAFIGIWSMLHVPDLALPVTTGPSGLPIGIQLIGRHGEDARLLALGRRIETLLAARA